MHKNDVTGKVTLITGGGSGIGLATAQRFLEGGAKVVVTDVTEEGLQTARSKLSGADVIASDAADAKAVTALFAEVKKRHGKLDVLFANAGICLFAPLDYLDADNIDRHFAVNVRGPILAIKAALELMPKGGSIIVNSSVLNVKGNAGSSVYSATKAALRSLTRTLAPELAPRGIRINAVSPGLIDTPIFGKIGLPPEAFEQFAKEILKQVPMGRLGRADEIAEGVAFLASEAASFITGTELCIDGGYGQI
jgi:NAD(P)-dependent dehydrogenase (short-subunit alcohol dehydrogenase family)